MPAVFEASVSQNRVPYSSRWVGCILHQINIAMKHSYENENDSDIRKDVESLKKLIRIFKNSGLNDKMSSGKTLKQ